MPIRSNIFVILFVMWIIPSIGRAMCLAQPDDDLTGTFEVINISKYKTKMQESLPGCIVELKPISPMGDSDRYKVYSSQPVCNFEVAKKIEMTISRPCCDVVYSDGQIPKQDDGLACITGSGRYVSSYVELNENHERLISRYHADELQFRSKLEADDKDPKAEFARVLKKANVKGDPLECEALGDKNRIRDCKGTVAREMALHEVTTAVKTNDVRSCKQFIHKFDRSDYDNCISQIIANTKRPDLCERYFGEPGNNTGKFKNCHHGFKGRACQKWNFDTLRYCFVSSGNLSSCEVKMSKLARNTCYSAFANCDKVMNAENKYKCEKNNIETMKKNTGVPYP